MPLDNEVIQELQVLKRAIDTVLASKATSNQVSDLETAINQKISSIYAIIDNTKRAIDTALARKADGSQMKDIESVLKDRMQSLQELIGTHANLNNSLHASARKSIQELVDSNFGGKIDSFNLKMEDLRKDHARIHASLGARIEQLAKDFESKADLLQKAVDKKPEELQEMKSALDAQHELMSYDVKNAVVRSQNTDQRLFLLEKKLENVTLLLKKYELTQ